MSNKIIDLKKCGVRFDPPSIMITYVTDTGKLHRRTMPIRNFKKTSGISRTAEDLRQSHKKYLESMPTRQLEKLLTLIQDHMKGISLNDSLKKNKELEEIDPEEDLNKVDDSTLARKKAVMDESFEKNRKKPGDPGFQYDVEVDFENDGPIETIDWDDDSDPDF